MRDELGSTQAPLTAFPVGRWVAMAFVAVWVPSYALTWGPRNFVLLCDIGVFITVLGLWRGSALLLSSQAVGGIVFNVLWTIDVASRFFFGHHAIGGTEYMWDSNHSLFVRLLSFFHLALPIVLVLALRRVGYDGRGYRLQLGILALALVIARIVGPQTRNPNFVFADPIWHDRLGPALVHLLAIYLVVAIVVYLPTHGVLRRLLPAAPRPGWRTANTDATT